MFRVNELVMYGRTGLCKISKIGKPDFFIDDNDRLYYFLEPIYQGGIIYAPVDNEKTSIRPVISKAEAYELLTEAVAIEPELSKCRSLQQQTAYYQSIIDSHDCFDLLKLAKAIYLKGQQASANKKKLGQIDKRFMLKAEDLLYGELAAALSMDKEQVAEIVHAKFGQEKFSS